MEEDTETPARYKPTYWSLCSCGLKRRLCILLFVSTGLEQNHFTWTLLLSLCVCCSVWVSGGGALGPVSVCTWMTHTHTHTHKHFVPLLVFHIMAYTIMTKTNVSDIHSHWSGGCSCSRSSFLNWLAQVSVHIKRWTCKPLDGIVSTPGYYSVTGRGLVRLILSPSDRQMASYIVLSEWGRNDVIS